MMGVRAGTTGRRALALIAVLWALMLAGIMLVGVQQAARITAAVGYNELASVQAHWLARAGVEQAIAELALTDPGVSSPLDYWYDDPFSFEAIELGTGRFFVLAPPSPEASEAGPRFGMDDLSARLNVNVADRESLQRLDLLDDGQIDALLDWREEGDRVRPGGAGRAYYQRLPYPYAIRNGPLNTLDELRLIRGIDDEAYFGEGASRAARLFPAAAAGPTVAGRSDDPRRLGLVGLATVHSHTPNRTGLGDDRINVNTADPQVLISRLNFSPPLASAVVQGREFDSLMDLLDVEADASSAEAGQAVDGVGSDDDETVHEITLEWLAANLDALTLTDDDRLVGLININTAPRPVLRTLPGVSAAVADGIVAHRMSAAGPFSTVGELLDVREVDEDVFRAVAERVGVTSSVFQVTAVGVAHRGMRQQIVAIIERDDEAFQILYWYQSE